ncbi:MAG: 3-oxoacyl-[acyl-carrier-protein] reductase [Bacteroidetes bacterium]|nr:3-oxoacyl-[acyl-carrier-protein] reductase [Bacteroidota bacterium]MCW5896627.1 3-oxoacyl-[acyl-carrier-protein] reductase [Bacteroidota bacterium]
MGILDNTVAVVTGGGRGIGRAIVVALAEAGSKVAFTYKSSATQADELVKELVAKGLTTRAYQADAVSTVNAAAVIDSVVKEFGRLDILVNNAGITKDGLLMRMSEEDWDTVLDNNLKSVFNYTKAACRTMMSQRSGKIINITSIVGVSGNAGQANYAASKAGIVGFTKSVAKELGSRNIAVNAVAPGYVETDMTDKLSDDQKKALADFIPLKRTAQAHEVASVVKFLASQDANYITGQVICVDGGMTM